MTDFQNQIQLALPSPAKLFTPAVTVILILMIIGYASAHYAADFVINTLGLSKAGLFSGKVWQLVTYPFFNGFCGLLFNGSVVLFFGSGVERDWRTRSFVVLWLVVSVICGSLWVFMSVVFGQGSVAMGTAPCAYGIIGTFGLLFRKQRFLLLLWAVEAQFIALFLIAIGLIISIVQPLHLIWVSGAMVAYLYVKLIWLIRSKPSFGTPKRSSGNRFVDLD